MKVNNFFSLTAIDCERPIDIENGRIIVVNDVTTYSGSAEYHCIPQYNRIGPYLRKCMEDGRWSGDEPRCECKNFKSILRNMKINVLIILVAVNDAQDESNFGTGVAIAAAIIVILLIFILIVFLHR